MPNLDSMAIIDPIPTDMGSLRVRILGEDKTVRRQLGAPIGGDDRTRTTILEETTNLTPSPIFTVVTLDQKYQVAEHRYRLVFGRSDK